MAPQSGTGFLLAHAARLQAYLRMLMGNQHDAEDVLQEVWMKFLRQGPGLKGDDAMRWLMRVARNDALNALRASRRRTAREGAYAPARPAELSPDEQAQRSESLARIESAMRKLDVEVREMVYLKLVEELPYREIAGRVGLPKSTVCLRVQEGLVRLSRHFHGEAS